MGIHKRATLQNLFTLAKVLGKGYPSTSTASNLPVCMCRPYIQRAFYFTLVQPQVCKNQQSADTCETHVPTISGTLAMSTFIFNKRLSRAFSLLPKAFSPIIRDLDKL